MIWSYEKMPDTGSSWREEGPAPKTKTKIGITLTLCPEDIPDKLLEDCALFHFGHPTLMRRMYEEEGAEGEESLRGHIRPLGGRMYGTGRESSADEMRKGRPAMHSSSDERLVSASRQKR